MDERPDEQFASIDSSGNVQAPQEVASEAAFDAAYGGPDLDATHNAEAAESDALGYGPDFGGPDPDDAEGDNA